MRGRLAVRQFRHLGVVGLDCGVHAPLNIKAESKTDCWGRIGPRGACHRQSGIVGRCPMRIKRIVLAVGLMLLASVSYASFIAMPNMTFMPKQSSQIVLDKQRMDKPIVRPSRKEYKTTLTFESCV